MFLCTYRRMVLCSTSVAPAKTDDVPTAPPAKDPAHFTSSGIGMLWGAIRVQTVYWLWVGTAFPHWSFRVLRRPADWDQAATDRGGVCPGGQRIPACRFGAHDTGMQSMHAVAFPPPPPPVVLPASRAPAEGHE
jgi:hypothetical protein